MKEFHSGGLGNVNLMFPLTFGNLGQGQMSTFLSLWHISQEQVKISTPNEKKTFYLGCLGKVN